MIHSPIIHYYLYIHYIKGKDGHSTDTHYLFEYQTNLVDANVWFCLIMIVSNDIDTLGAIFVKDEVFRTAWFILWLEDDMKTVFSWKKQPRLYLWVLT